MILPPEHFAEVIDRVPLLCVDIVLTSNRGEHLLVRRNNEPRKGEWWVVGGRVLKGETIRDAAIRKVSEEVGLVADGLEPVGYYEDPAQVDPFGRTTPYHAVSVVFQGSVADHPDVKLDAQSLEWRFSQSLPEGFRIQRWISQ
jgi:colanic acid biosynthesis protein WcaH